MTVEVFLFPMRTSGDSEDYTKYSDHWTMLKYNVQTHEWCFYNSAAAPLGQDCHLDRAMLVVEYVHDLMCRLVRKQGKQTHSLVRRAIRMEVLVDCPQEYPGSFDSAVVQCSNLENNVVRSHKEVQNFSVQLAGEYRCKMVSWIVDSKNTTML